MKKILNKIKNKYFAYIVICCLLMLPFVTQAAEDVNYASMAGNLTLGVLGSAVAAVVGAIAFLLTSVIGLLITVIVKILIQVAQFNDIISVPTVIQGWTIVRDICNMFFILILLVIAFSTILRREEYSAKKLLPKLLIMAVLINFSRTIFGVIIDFSQVIMLTFVNAFSQGGGWFINMFRIDLLLSINSIKSSGDFAVTSWAAAVAIIAGVLASIITLIIMVVMLAVLVMRIVLLWIYTIFSPLIFLGFAFPPIKAYTGRIWEDFIKQAVSGPILAFFIWLALTTASTSATFLNGSIADDTSQLCVGAGAFFCDKNLQNFIIVIGLLVGGLMVTQQIGGAAGNMAGKGLAWSKNASKTVGKAVGYIPGQYAKRAGYEVGDRALNYLKGRQIIGNLAMKGQAKLRMKREYAEEKDTRYTKYLRDDDLDLIRNRYTEGDTWRNPFSRIARGMESNRQDYKRALKEKMARGEYFANNQDVTRMIIDGYRLSGHTVTPEGDDIYYDNDFGNATSKFLKKRITSVDINQFRNSMLPLRNRVQGANNLRSFDTRINDIAAYVIDRMTETDLKEQPASALRDGNNYRILQSFYNRRKLKPIARIYDLETGAKSEAVEDFMRHVNPGQPDNVIFGDRVNDFGLLGQSRAIMNKTNNPVVASGLTGINENGELTERALSRGRLAAPFSQLGLDTNSSGLYFGGEDKTKVINRIGTYLRKNSMAEEVAKSIEEQLHKANSLILRNKEAMITPSESRTAHAHEIMHSRLDSTFTNTELRNIWDSMNENHRKNAADTIRSIWGKNMEEDEVMREYFAEGLTAKTRWGKGAVVRIDSTTEGKLNGALKTKGSDINSFTSNLTQFHTQREEIRSTFASAVNDNLKQAMENLTDSLSGIGNGFIAVERMSTSIDNLEQGIYKNNLNLEKNASEFKNVSDELNGLKRKYS